MTDLIGLPATALACDLVRVAPEHQRRPVLSFDVEEMLGPDVRAYMDAYHDEGSRIVDHLQHLPAGVYARLPVDERAKAAFSAESALDGEVLKKLHADPAMLLVHKLKSSMWRWGFTEATWNEIVDGYDGLRSFDLGIDGLSVTIDHTDDYRERGRGVRCEKWLDGVFAFLVHHRGRHVMTIGFSIAGNRRILLQQVQTTSRTGNRWLFKLPANRMEFVVDRLHAAFPAHTVMVADGADIAKANLKLYAESLKFARKLQEHARDSIERGGDGQADLLEATGRARDTRTKIAHLRADKPRLAALYRDVGRYTLGTKFRSHDVTHYALAA